MSNRTFYYARQRLPDLEIGSMQHHVHKLEVWATWTQDGEPRRELVFGMPEDKTELHRELIGKIIDGLPPKEESC